MMNSIAEQVITLMVAAVINQTDAQDRVFRSRTEAVTRQEAPSIVIKPIDEESTAFSDSVDDDTLSVSVEVFVRGDPYDQLADPVVTAAHQLLTNNPDLRNLVTSFRKKSRAWEGSEADETAGFVTVKYDVRYLTAANDMTAAV